MAGLAAEPAEAGGRHGAVRRIGSSGRGRSPPGTSRIRVTDLENRLGGSHYTADTLRALRRRFPRLRFVWLMGGDNLVQIPRWERWTEIFRTVPIAVFDRPSYSLKALAGRGCKALCPAPPDRPAPRAGWPRQNRRPGCFSIPGSIRRSATRIRAERKTNAVTNLSGARTRIGHDHRAAIPHSRPRRHPPSLAAGAPRRSF